MTWTRSSRCESNSCAEAARFGEHVHFRSSLLPHLVAVLTREEWEEHLKAVRAGEFDFDQLVEEAL